MVWISRIHADSCRTSPFHRLTCDNRSLRRSRGTWGRPHPEPAMRSPCSLGRVPTSVTTSSASCARPPAIIEDLHTIADLRDPDQIRRDSDAGATRWPRDQPWITRTMHRTAPCVSGPGPRAMRASRQWGPCFLRMAGGTGVRGDAATYPSTEDARRRPRSRSKRPSCSTGGCDTTCCTKDTGPLRATQPVRPPPCRRPAAYA